MAPVYSHGQASKRPSNASRRYSTRLRGAKSGSVACVRQTTPTANPRALHNQLQTMQAGVKYSGATATATWAGASVLAMAKYFNFHWVSGQKFQPGLSAPHAYQLAASRIFLVSRHSRGLHYLPPPAASLAACRTHNSWILNLNNARSLP